MQLRRPVELKICFVDSLGIEIVYTSGNRSLFVFVVVSGVDKAKEIDKI